ncbi:histone deacetylase family protein [Salinisphaera sp. SWV1]|uniref:histone deacetylase family protein n=1 Tax=Salinisphaera sp. SWV1 TaxID=3454139 RepID=UPI003F8625E6
MLTFHDNRTQNRRSATELAGGRLIAPLECPERVDMIAERIRTVGLGAIRGATMHGLEPIAAVHDPAYIDFLENAWADWRAAGHTGEAIASVWPTRRTRADFVPRHIDGRLGYYALAAETAIEAGTWEAARASVDIALTALDHVQATGEAAFGLCRPPGHHAAFDQYGGYCFFNNAAIAAQAAREAGAARVAILDVDYHHGNGTQQILYDRDDVLFVSLHCDPLDEFPHYLGCADELGVDAGEGYNRNHTLPPGADYAAWLAELEAAMSGIDEYDPDLVIVSLGVDTFAGDPIGRFKLGSDDFTDYGRRLAGMNRPTLFLMEGGYAVAEIGVNVVNVLSGFDHA